MEMSKLNERLDALKELIQTDDFLEGKGLSNEVNFRIFCYDPAEEMAVRYYVSKLVTDPGLKCRIIERNLYKIFLSICEDMDIMDAIPEMEEEDGPEYLLEQLHSTAGQDAFIEKMQYEDHERGDVVILTGVGNVYPFMRVHTILEAMQTPFSDVPVLVFYPGQYDGHQLKLFGKLEPSPYYRAFNTL